MDGVLALGGVVLVALAALLLMGARRKRPRAEIPRAAPPPSPRTQLQRLRQAGGLWGVRVESHCRASSRLAGREYTFESPPMLPVEGCTETRCTCCLVGLPERRRITDRRSGSDRRESLRMEATDRRSDQPRRGSDLNSWVAYGHL